MFDDKFFGNPEISGRAFISSKSTIIGLIFIGDDVIIAPNCSIRADEGTPFFISYGTNIQDGVIMHGLLNKTVEADGGSYSIWIGSHCSIAHRALIHGPTFIGKKTFIGFDAIIHGSRLGRNCFVDFRATIKNSEIGDDCHIGVGAMIVGVRVKNERYVPDGMIVNTQEIADSLPRITRAQHEKDKEFNKEVVDYNKKLVFSYKKRRRLKRKK